VKGPGSPVSRYLPTPGQRRNKPQLIIRLYQRTVELMDNPHDGAVLCKSRVQRRNAIGLIIIKYLFPGIGLPGAATREQGQHHPTARTKEKNGKEMFIYLHLLVTNLKLKIANES
jgi:CubicO group peptidase (beta-lactamase class C family)